VIREWLVAIVLRCVPRAWRDDIRRDLAEEDARWLWVAARTVSIGIHLRAARLADALRNPSRRGLQISRRLSMPDLGRDVRLALRGAVRQPGYALAVVGTLAIGIGANTAIFSLFNWILFRPLPGVARPGELVTILYQTDKRTGNLFVSYRDYQDLREHVKASLTDIAVAVAQKMDVSTGGDSERIDTELVTVNYLSLLGVRPTMGRDFTAEEEQPGGPASVIISDRLWHRTFGSNPAALGQVLQLNGRGFTVIGVAPAKFQGRSTVIAVDVWLTLSGYASLLPRAEDRQTLLTSRRQTIFVDSFARLRPGATLEQAQAEAAAAAANLPEFASARARPGRPRVGPVLHEGIGPPLHAQERLTTVFRVLIGTVGLLLLLACANAANLLLARIAARRREIAVCQAIGASRFRVIRQQVIEGLVFSLAAGIGGLALAVWLTWLFEGMRIVSALPPLEGVALDWRVGLFALMASIATGLIFAAVPAFVSSRADLQSSLKMDVTTSRGGRRLLRGTLVTVQIAVSVLLLVAAGLFIRTLQNIRGIDLGIQPEGVVSLGIEPGRFGLSGERSAAYVSELLDRIRMRPGVTSAAFSWTTSLSSNRNDMVFARPEAPDVEQSAAQTSISPGFFATMRMPLIAGRDFTEAETQAGSDVAGPIIISRRLAETVFPEGSALGSRLTLRYPKGKVVEVVGIVGDVRGRAVTIAPEAWAYTPSVNPTWGTILVRSPLPEAQVVAMVREVARGIDPIVAPHDIEGLGASVDRALSEQRLFARTVGIFAAVAAILAGVGIYAMMAGAVAERRKEFGIRLALGAKRSSVLTLVVRSAVSLAALGLATGLGGAAALRRVVEARLYGVTSLDPLTIGLAVTAILLLSVVASLVPALRAAHVDPVRSLRVD
jgi:putative ABC transport system permease protein